ncbi:MAG: glycosyltransferase [Clostridia bacterium]|nr:glycosyltransferase [Clostridia bacterium]
MKILLLTDRMEAGGAETHLVQLAKDLQKKQHDVLLWCSGGRLAKALEQEGIRCILQPPPTHNPLALFFRRQRLIRLIKKERIKVLHAHTRLTAQLIRGLQRLGCAEIVTVHAQFYANALLSRISYWGQATIAVSEDLREYVANTYRLSARQITVIPNGIDCHRYAPKKRTHSGIRLLFASRLDTDCSHGADLLCRLAPRLCSLYPDLQITIAGGGSEYPRISAVAQSVNRALGRACLKLLGWVDDMASLLRGQDIFVGVSRAAMEAAASGCAVILCGNEGYLGILDESTLASASLTNFCARGEPIPDADRLFLDLCTLINDPSLRQCSAAAGMSYVRQFLDSEVLCCKTEQIYRQALPRKKRCRLTVGGYFGCGNLGDDAILQGLLHEIDTCHPTLLPTVLSGSAFRDRKQLGVPTVQRKYPVSVAYAILRSRLFLLGGGSLLQNRTGNLSLAYYLGLLRLSHLFHRKTALYACGIGPLLGESATDRVKKALRSVSHIGLRDERSHALLRSLDISEERLSVGADACFLLPLPPTSLSLYLRKKASIPQNARLLGIVLRSTENDTPLLSAITAICRSHGLLPIVLTLDSKHDKIISDRAARDLHAPCITPSDPQAALAWLSSCQAVLSMRLHGMLLAARVGTPALGVCTDSHDEKMPAFARASCLPCLPLSSLSEKAVTNSLTDLILAADTIRPRLLSLAREMQKNAQKDLAKLLQIVYNKGKKSPSDAACRQGKETI